MSITLMNQVWRLTLPSSEKIVLLSLADQANESAICWPSLPTIAMRCGMTERGISNIIQRLAAKNLITKNTRAGTSTRYVLLPLNMIHPTPEPYSTPEHHSSLNVVHGTPEPAAGYPLHEVPPTPEHHSGKPPMNHQKNPNEPKTAPFSLPDFIPQELWMEFEALRRQKRKPLTEASRRINSDKLAKLAASGHDVKEVLEETISHGWDSFYPPRGHSSTAKAPARVNKPTARTIS